jgi:hypothetical protein
MSTAWRCAVLGWMVRCARVTTRNSDSHMLYDPRFDDASNAYNTILARCATARKSLASRFPLSSALSRCCCGIEFLFISP